MSPGSNLKHYQYVAILDLHFVVSFEDTNADITFFTVLYPDKFLKE